MKYTSAPPRGPHAVRWRAHTAARVSLGIKLPELCNRLLLHLNAVNLTESSLIAIQLQRETARGLDGDGRRVTPRLNPKPCVVPGGSARTQNRELPDPGWSRILLQRVQHRRLQGGIRKRRRNLRRRRSGVVPRCLCYAVRSRRRRARARARRPRPSNGSDPGDGTLCVVVDVFVATIRLTLKASL